LSFYLNSIRLREIGPRIDLELVKIQDGFFEGKTIYHAFCTVFLYSFIIIYIYSLINYIFAAIRTPQEEAQISLRKQQEKSLKERRRTEQEENVRKKLAKKGKRILPLLIRNQLSKL
jgi:ribosome biogenesis protein SSF1/2